MKILEIYDKNDRDKLVCNNLFVLNELEKFLDKTESIKDENLRKDIVIQMLKCDNELTLCAEKIFEEKYNMGIIKGKTTNN